MGGDPIQLAVVIAEFALDVAAVGLADGAQPRAHQAGEAALGKALFLAHVIGAALQAFQARNVRHQAVVSRVHGVLYLRQNGVHNLLLGDGKLLLLGQLGKKGKPAQGVLLGNLHRYASSASCA